MDVERFATELPQLFDDFPSSTQPRGRRFDDVLAGVGNYASENNLALLNLAAGLLEPGESYVEVGTFQGASLIAAMRDNEGDFVAIESFAFDGTSRDGLESNLLRFGATGATILEGDVLEVLGGRSLGDRHVGVFYLDAVHDYDNQLQVLTLVEPWLAARALIVIDDADWEQVERAAADYLGQQPQAQRLFRIGGKNVGAPQWWEGVGVLAWSGAPS